MICEISGILCWGMQMHKRIVVVKDVILERWRQKNGCPLKKTVSSRVESKKIILTVTQGSLSKPRTQNLNPFPEKGTIQYSLEYEKEVQTGKTKSLHVEEALILSSGGKKYGCPLKKTVSSRLVSTKFMLTVTQGNPSKPRMQILNSFPEKSTIQDSLE
ncbi:hypothetical protein H5410_064977 [Solanum commersonii]|uniref:Uncharacterized protein n=1 Tax=Solanum commersonii TaxID=4109 RepID=A0A9J5VY60_SOLCO|nr:hypothetical protein H5410_064977 [Solanum commersonii]